MRKIFRGPLVLLLSLLSLITIVSCEKDKEDVDDAAPGVIYLRIQSDGGFDHYNDDNPTIPHGFTESRYYGPCESGSYSYSAEVNGYTWTNRTYTLSKPADGKRRNYTLGFIATGTGMSAVLNSEDVDQ
ncbi:hypothetical protein [Flaviaesturariibacter amylovorans]|uniref:DUF4377 domain-containing protein n=1 Tax=Flaviaesturariibacter amylovorans TaxID=1084520 RepID=A0ABP8G460_9BACT